MPRKGSGLILTAELIKTKRQLAEVLDASLPCPVRQTELASDVRNASSRSSFFFLCLLCIIAFVQILCVCLQVTSCQHIIWWTLVQIVIRIPKISCCGQRILSLV
ncbi:hypothetical protein TNIN_2721 [Trichonephila inaurata madagascariensis]|uniref:Uncharacterized protein n=1 Tax=Trichonephila inaurata madagascariensis TaxID=2747483 RepID=A0A8X6YAU5_9ARAC|nr:hypothetical protein TNIN_2721 [Trichonephila inaurata madagascariensis]